MKYEKYIGVLLLFGIMICSCEDILEVPDISNQQIQILAPTNGATILANKVNFNWNPIEEATGYQIEVAHPNFENATQIVLDSLMVVDSLGFINTKINEVMLNNGSYEWRVKAVNSDFETLFTTSAFTIEGAETPGTSPFIN